MKKREYLGIYFADKHEGKKKKRDLTLAFRADDPLYGKCKNLGSAGIKRILGTDSYKELSSKAQRDNRSVNNYVKGILRNRLLKGGRGCL